MKLITWNIQWGRGIDGRIDLERIVRHARAMADFDVICMQEVADNFPGLEGNDDRDQFAELAKLPIVFLHDPQGEIDESEDGQHRAENHRRRGGLRSRAVQRALPEQVRAEQGHNPAVAVLRVAGPIRPELIEQAAPDRDQGE